MEKYELLSIIVPVYNVEKYIDRCIKSLVDQTYSKKEIILVDDGSTDGSGEKCDSWAKEYTFIKVIHKDNGGLSSARNTGLDHAEGTFLGFVDSDDYVASDMYEKLIYIIKKYDVKMSVCGRFNVYEDGEIKKGICPDSTKSVIRLEDAISRILIWDGMDTSVCDKCFTRELWERIRFPEGEIGEDTAVLYNVLEKALYIGVVSERFYYYFQRSGSISKSRFSERKMDIIKHADQIYDYVRKIHPKCIKAAAYFRVVEIEAVIDMIQSLDNDERKKYKKEEKVLKSELKKMASFWVFDRRIGKGKKFKYLRLIMG